MEAVGIIILMFLGIYGVIWISVKADKTFDIEQRLQITKIVQGELCEITFSESEMKKEIERLKKLMEAFKHISTYDARIINMETTLRENLRDFKFCIKQHEGMWRYLDIIMNKLGEENIVNEYYKADGIELIRCKPIPIKETVPEPLTYVEDERDTPLKNSEYVKEHYIKMKRDVLENGYFDNRWYKEGNVYKVRSHFGNWAFVHGHGVYTYLQEKDFELLNLDDEKE